MIKIRHTPPLLIPLTMVLLLVLLVALTSGATYA